MNKISSEVNNHECAFKTYKNYLMHYSLLIDKMYPEYQDLRKQLKPVHRKNNGKDLNKIRTRLYNCWNTELLLNFPEFSDDNFLQYSNHWSSVQCYYCFYLSLRALFAAMGDEPNRDHNKTLKHARNLIEKKMMPEPWALIRGKKFKGLPDNYNPGKISSLANPLNFANDESKLWDMACKMLRTTQEREIKRKRDEWIKGKSNKKADGTKYTILPPGMKDEIASKTSVSIFDFFYRLRCRSNYKDADIFILGSSTPETCCYFESLRNITDMTLFIIECYILQYLGKDCMKQLIFNYQNTDKRGINNFLKYSVCKRSQYYL